MKIRKLALPLLIMLIAVSCKKDKIGQITFTVYSEAQYQIPPSTLLDVISILTPGVSTNWDGDFANNNANKDKIDNMKLKDLTLVITNPPGKTFKFIHDIDIYIQAEGLQETKIAYAHDIPDNVGQTLSLTPIDVDLAPYARKDNFKLRVSTKPDEYNSDYVNVTAQMHFDITADVLN